jgi:hypothetical protein
MTTWTSALSSALLKPSTKGAAVIQRPSTISTHFSYSAKRRIVAGSVTHLHAPARRRPEPDAEIWAAEFYGKNRSWIAECAPDRARTDFISAREIRR